MSTAQLASISTLLSSYKEEFETNTVSYIAENELQSQKSLSAFGKNVKKYIPSLKDNMQGDFGIVCGKLYYLGDDVQLKNASKQVGILCLDDEKDVDEAYAELENDALKGMIEESSDSFKEIKDDGEEYEIGEKLYDKNPDNMNIWNVVTEVKDNKVSFVYGTGWFYLKKGDKVNDIVLENNYMANYETNQIVQFNSKYHTKMGVRDNAVAIDNLIFNADPSVMEDFYLLEDKSEFDVSKLGENIEFFGYEDENGNLDLENAFTKSSFEFDGEDDYIRIPYNSETNFEEGLTFEFYGKINGGSKSRDYNQTEFREGDDYYHPFFSLMKNSDNDWGYVRFGAFLDTSNKTKISDIVYNINQVSVDSYFSINSSKWNQYIRLSSYNKELKVGDTFHFAVVLDGKELEQRVFLNGQYLDGGYIADSSWNSFINSSRSGTYKYINIGKAIMGNYAGQLWFSNFSAFSMHLYNIPLADEDVETNYNKAVSYHEFLEVN